MPVVYTCMLLVPIEVAGSLSRSPHSAAWGLTTLTIFALLFEPQTPFSPLCAHYDNYSSTDPKLTHALLQHRKTHAFRNPGPRPAISDAIAYTKHLTWLPVWDIRSPHLFIHCPAMGVEMSQPSRGPPPAKARPATAAEKKRWCSGPLTRFKLCSLFDADNDDNRRRHASLITTWVAALLATYMVARKALAAGTEKFQIIDKLKFKGNQRGIAPQRILSYESTHKPNLKRREGEYPQACDPCSHAASPWGDCSAFASYTL